MQLDIVETILSSQPFHLLRILINEHSHPLHTFWQIVKALTHIPTGLGPEDKAHHIDTEGFHFANVIGLAHATNLYYHSRSFFARTTGLKDIFRQSC